MARIALLLHAAKSLIVSEENKKKKTQQINILFQFLYDLFFYCRLILAAFEFSRC